MYYWESINPSLCLGGTASCHVHFNFKLISLLHVWYLLHSLCGSIMGLSWDIAAGEITTQTTPSVIVNYTVIYASRYA